MHNTSYDYVDHETRFRDIAIGATFRFGRYSESGLVIDLDDPTPGTVVYRRTSARTYVRVDNSQRFRVGSINVRVWAGER